MGCFDKRLNYKPFEYTEAITLMEKLNHTYWLHSELPFKSDKHEFETLRSHEKEATIRNLCAISTIEIAVKEFWGQLGQLFPKAEFSMLGTTAAETEVRHAESYSRILSLLGIEDIFLKALNNPVLRGRFDYLNKYLDITPKTSDKKKQLIKVILFAILIENTSLFGQFAGVMYLYRSKGVMKDIRNIIKWTAIDEQLHFNIGVMVVSIVRKEYPELFDEDLEDLVKKACLKSLKHEKEILEWIFEKGEFEGLSVIDIHTYMKSRVNDSMEQLGFSKVFVEELNLENTKFFYEEVFVDSMDDFFAVRPVDYTLGDVSITGDDLF